MVATSLHRTVLALGEVLWDVLPNEKLLGGAPANFCHRLRQLGVPALIVSRIGKDTLGSELSAGLRTIGFDLSLLQEDAAHPTGTVDVVLTNDGNPSFTINTDVAYDYLEATPELLDAARKADFICFGTLVQRSQKTRETIYTVLKTATHATKFLDINLRRNCYCAETVAQSLRLTDILKLNQSEVKTVAELLGLPSSSPKEMAQAVMKEYGVKTVLVTLGEAGVYAIDAAGKESTVPGISITVADTIGSGDSFSAGFAFKYLQNASLEECCLFGNFMGALNATRKGGMPDVSPSELDEFLRHHSKAA